MSPLLPGETIGILGGGQLGRMMAMAARSLGYHIHVLDPDPSCASRFVVEQLVTASFDDVEAARQLALGCSVLTLEIEKVGLEGLEAAARYTPVRPSAEVLRVIQSRGRQKAWLVAHGFPVGPFQTVSSLAELEAASRKLGGRCFLKAAEGGYDGRGQARISVPEEAARAWVALGEVPCVVEQALALRLELSVLVARRPSGEMRAYAPALNHHVHGILEWSVLPGPVDAAVAQRATEIALTLAEDLKVEGLLVTEFFLTESGELLVNELAPRPHNSFHTTEVSCSTSQFEQAIRAVCDMPLGSTEVVRPGAITNLLGDLWLGDKPPPFDRVLAMPDVRVHLYGKRQARPGRKMGHLSATGRTPAEALERVERAQAELMRAAPSIVGTTRAPDVGSDS